MRNKVYNKNHNRLSGLLLCSLTGLFVLLSVFPVQSQNYWTPNINAFDNYMTITAYLVLNEQELKSDKIEVGCFIDNECRGVYRLQPIEYKGHPYTCFLAVWGSASDNGKAITVKVFDHEAKTVMEAEQKPEYLYNGDLGTNDPYKFTLSKTTGKPVVESSQAGSLRAYIQNGQLYVGGLTVGKSWSVYNLAGMLLYQGIATSNVETLRATSVQSVQNCSILIIQSGKESIKFFTPHTSYQ